MFQLIPTRKQIRWRM